MALKTFVRAAIFLFFIPASAGAQTENNPYMPSRPSGYGNATMFPAIPDAQRDQLMAVPSANDVMPPVDVPLAADPPPSPPVDPTPAISNSAYQELRSQQADDAAAVAREKADLEYEMKALKDAVDTQLRDMQKKIDLQQKQIEDLRYESRH